MRDPRSSFELSLRLAGCHIDKGKVISWGRGRPLDKSLFPSLKKYQCLLAAQIQIITLTVLPYKDIGLYRWPECQWAAVFLCDAGCQEVNDRQTQHENNLNIMMVSVCFIAADGKDIEKGRARKKIRLWDSGSLWLPIGKMLQLFLSLKYNMAWY